MQPTCHLRYQLLESVLGLSFQFCIMHSNASTCKWTFSAQRSSRTFDSHYPVFRYQKYQKLSRGSTNSKFDQETFVSLAWSSLNAALEHAGFENVIGLKQAALRDSGIDIIQKRHVGNLAIYSVGLAESNKLACSQISILCSP